MAKSEATTVAQYLAELPPERRAIIKAVRAVIRKNLPKGYAETMNWGVICYEVPLKRYPNTYNKKPLAYAALAAQKNYYALYLTCIFSCPASEQKLRAEFAAVGKKLDVGKSCVRFKAIDDLPLDAIGRIIAETPVDALIEHYEASRKKK
jgi:hypothetical protein